MSTEKIDRIVAYLQEHAHADGSWVLPDGIIREAFGLNAADYLRTIYGLPNVNASEIVDGIGDGNSVALIELLEALTGRDLPGPVLDRAGVFLSFDSRARLQEMVIEEATHQAATVEIDYTHFSGLCDQGKSVNSAVERYIHDHLQFDATINAAVDDFVAREGFLILRCARREAMRYLRLLVSRHVLEPQFLASPMRSRLNRFAENAFFTDFTNEKISGEEETGHWWRRRTEHPPEVLEAIRVFGFSSTSVSRDGIRRRYRELMKIFHPDVNALGLKRAQEITRAYAILSSFI